MLKLNKKLKKEKYKFSFIFYIKRLIKSIELIKKKNLFNL